MDSESWEGIGDHANAQEQYDKFSEIYAKHYDTAYPLITKRVSRKNERVNPKPWILPWLEDACARKNESYHKFVKFPTSENKAAYEKLKGFCEKHTKRQKKNIIKIILKNLKIIPKNSGNASTNFWAEAREGVA